MLWEALWGSEGASLLNEPAHDVIQMIIQFVN